MVFLGVDVATSCGWALIEAGRRGGVFLVDSGVLGLGDDWSKQSQTQWLLDKALGCPELTVGLEEPYLDTDKKRNPHTFKVLCMLVGWFQHAFVSERVVLVPAQTWQTAVFGRFGGKKREDRKKACLLWARATFGRNLPEDAADAAGLAYYLATKERAR